ncbi:hypothetical protein B0T17DRAFT_617026 [Bombardia bombarda]|uniref:BTB domain-containing protein n=1 Tax=Bombardia bombarda TaxID=252184 RepID=A0AA40C5B4_9PEZI|nr:hypothetical protein B0T17DRAFT_617026 [Bombardia bombarda]
MAPKTIYDKLNIISRNGDLVLLVGPRKVEFQVCSHTLARSSRVFDRMLNGKLAEGRDANKKTGEGEEGKSTWTVALPDDDMRGMQLLL